MNMLRTCYDWRVLTGLAALGIGIYFVAPGLVAAALPLLVLAACPLSMLLMMKAMGGSQAPSSSAPEAGAVDRVAVLRHELASLGQRQEQLAEELRAIEAAPRDDPDARDERPGRDGPLLRAAEAPPDRSVERTAAALAARAAGIEGAD